MREKGDIKGPLMKEKWHRKGPLIREKGDGKGPLMREKEAVPARGETFLDGRGNLRKGLREVHEHGVQFRAQPEHCLRVGFGESVRASE